MAAAAVDRGGEIFRHDTFNDELYWTDTPRMHEVIAAAVDPVTALSVGLKVDADALPPGILESADLTDPATTVALLGLGVVYASRRSRKGRIRQATPPVVTDGVIATATHEI